MNRALANLKIRSYDQALKDVKVLIAQDHPPQKALYRASQALYYLGRFRLCLEMLVRLLRDYPENQTAIREKFRAEQRLVEQKNGRYDFDNMYFAARAKSLYLDNASYVGSVKVKSSEGRGLGLFTTKNVVAGELLLCEKAFSYSHEDKNAGNLEDSPEIPILANMLTNRITVGTQVDLLKETIQKLKWNPSFLSSVTALHHGSYKPAEETNEDVIDTYVPCRIHLSMQFYCGLLIFKPSCLHCYCCCFHYATASEVYFCQSFLHDGAFTFSSCSCHIKSSLDRKAEYQIHAS